MRVLAMFRVSTETQANEGASLDAQQRRYRELAKSHGWITVAEFKGCESATQASKERRVLQQILTCIQEQEPDAIYVHEQSRLTRGDELEVALLLRELKERGLKIIINGVIRDLNSIDERFMVGIQSLVDRTESERIKERHLRGKREKAKQGKKNSGFAPYGYYNPAHRNPNRGTLQIVEEEAFVVRRVFDYAVKGLSNREISRRLNSAGIPAPRGNKWGKTTIHNILNNLAYIGIHASNVWVAESGSRTFRLNLSNPNAIIVENAHEAIVSREVWDAVQSRPKPLRTGKPNMLTGMLYVNGVPFSGNSNHGQSFYCNQKPGYPWLPTDSTNEIIWDAFVYLARQPKFVAAMIQEAQEQRKTDVLASEIEVYSAQITRYNNRLERLVDMRADGDISKAVFLRKTGETKDQLDRAENELRRLRAELASTDSSMAERVVKAVQTLIVGKNKLILEQKKKILQTIVKKIEVTAERTKHHQRRNHLGQLQSSTGPKWMIKDVFLKLAVPADDRSGDLAISLL